MRNVCRVLVDPFAARLTAVQGERPGRILGCRWSGRIESEVYGVLDGCGRSGQGLLVVVGVVVLIEESRRRSDES